MELNGKTNNNNNGQSRSNGRKRSLPAIEVRQSNVHGQGVFATRAIPKGRRIVEYTGERMAWEAASEDPDDPHTFLFGLSDTDDVINAAIGGNEARWINHSCDPNAGLNGQIVLVAMHEIATGEEIRFDYAMSDVTDYDEFKCECGAPNCRGVVRGSDWRRPELWEKYAGYFSPYIQRRIEKLKRGEPVP